MAPSLGAAASTSPGVPSQQPSAADSSEALMRVHDVSSAAVWANLSGAANDAKTPLGALLTALGNPSNLRDIAFIDQELWRETVANVKVQTDATPRGLSPIEKSQVAQFKYAASRTAGPDALAPLAAAASQTLPPAAVHTQSERTSGGDHGPRLSTLFGATDTALIKLKIEDISKYFMEYKKSRGDFPGKDVEPSQDQLSAICQLINAGLVPYVDFALFGPCNSKFQEKMKYVTSKFDPINQTWSKVELPGPRTYDEWHKAWCVFECCLLLLRTVSPERLAAYARLIKRFHDRFGQKCWFIIYQADVLMRSETMDRIRRNCISVGSTASAPAFNGCTFHPATPWEYVFAVAASETEPESAAFWTENISHKCFQFLLDERQYTPGSQRNKRYAPDAINNLPPGKRYSSPLPAAWDAPEPRQPKMCTEFLGGRCLGPECPLGYRHSPCPLCQGYHPKFMCPNSIAAAQAASGFQQRSGPKGGKDKGKGGRWTFPDNKGRQFPPPPPPAAVGKGAKNKKGK